MTKYIVFGWSPDSVLADELLGTTSEYDEVEREYIAKDEDGWTQFGWKVNRELVKLDAKLFQGKEFEMIVCYSYSGKFEDGKRKRILAYYEVPGT